MGLVNSTGPWESGDILCVCVCVFEVTSGNNCSLRSSTQKAIKVCKLRVSLIALGSCTGYCCSHFGHMRDCFCQ